MDRNNDTSLEKTSPSWWDIRLFLATGGWVGLIAPFAPGTFGTVVGFLPVGVMVLIPNIWGQVAWIVFLCAIGIPICDYAAKKLNTDDPGQVVWDEIASLPMTFFLIPVNLVFTPGMMILGFILNRVFDITKPPPAKKLEALHGGFGIMADDWIAGLYSCIVLHLLARAFGWIV